MDAEVVEHDDLARAQAGDQDPVPEGLEDESINGPRTKRLSPKPVTVKVASQEIASRRPRGIRPYARCPRAARARKGVKVVGVLVPSRKTSCAGSTSAIAARQAARATSSRSAAIRLFF